MEAEASSFESSEMLATFLASTPLLEESWKLCRHANASAMQNFVANRVGEVTYVAFPGAQNVVGSNSCCRDLVALGTAVDGVFTAFNRHVVDDEELPMVHAGLLQLFLAVYNNQIFRDKISEIVNESKSVVFTGHSLGGAIASLTALWLLSSVQNTSLSMTVFCITFGSPLLGNESLSRAILHERWGGNFYHVVGQHDIVPRFLFAPSPPFILQLCSFFQSLLFSPPPYHAQLAVQLSEENKAELFHTVLACLEANSTAVSYPERSQFWPFGSYMFCTDRGSICIDNPTAIVKLLYLMLATGSPSSCMEDHLKYDVYVGRSCWQYLMRTSFTEGSSTESSYEAGIALALESAGIKSHEPAYGLAKDCLKMANQVGCRRNLNNAKLAVDLSKITPLRAQIEWYKAFCDDSDDQMGYYDAFKRRSASKRGNKVNMNRCRLAVFWDNVVDMVETNQLPYDFHRQPKYVNASHFYKLLVEPLEIAEYYRNGMHKKKGNYIEHGRGKRFQIFDKWWKDRKVGEEENSPRSRFASLTQDSCFWARVEDARDCIFEVASEMDMGRHLLLLEKIEMFEQYAIRMIERKEVSKDVIAKNSSYNLFVGEWRELKSHLHPRPLHFPSFQDGGNMVP